MINHEIWGVFKQPDLCIPETHRSDGHSNPFSGTASFSCGFTYVVFSFYGRRVVKLGSHLTFPHDRRNVPNWWLLVQMQQLFEAMDANHDGVLSRKEFEQAPMESPMGPGITGVT